MESSKLGHENIIAAANMETEMVFPNRRGVLTKISWGVESQELISSSLLCDMANAPGPSLLKNILAQLFRYSS
jgi:hypothetical protein